METTSDSKSEEDFLLSPNSRFISFKKIAQYWKSNDYFHGIDETIIEVFDEKLSQEFQLTSLV